MAKKVLITGASSGIGRDIARVFDSYGCELIITARREDRLAELSHELKGNPRVIVGDISGSDGAKELYEMTKDENIDILVNNAGFGVWGDFSSTDLDRELDMIRLNIETMHTLFKLFLRDFKARGSGKILNTASMAGFAPGPYMAAYYASKAYVLRLTQSAAGELKESGSPVTVSALCPGPVETEFNTVAGVHFATPSLSSEYVAKYAVTQLVKGKTVIIPGTMMKVLAAASKVLPDSFTAEVTSNIQRRKGNKKER